MTLGFTTAIDLVLFAGSAFLLFVFLRRFEGTGLVPPLAVIWGSAASLGAVGAAIHVAAEGGQLELAARLYSSILALTAFTIPGFLHLATKYPRPIHAWWTGPAVGGAYGVALLSTVLSPTPLMVAGFSADAQGHPILIDGPFALPVQYPMFVALIGGVGWLGYLVAKGRTAGERRDAAGIVIAALPATAAYAVLLAGGSPPVVSDLAEPLPFIYLWLVFAGAFVIFTGRLVAPQFGDSGKLLDSVAEAVLIVDNDGLVATVNPSAERLLGREASSLVTEPLQIALRDALASPQEADLLGRTVIGVMRGRLEAHAGTLKGVGPGKRTCRIQILPVGGRTPRGEAAAAVVLFSDETERAAHAEATSRSRDTLDLVIRMLGHDLKAPLTVVQGYIDLDKMRLDGGGNPKDVSVIRSDLDKMSEAIVEMQILMGNARALSRLAAVGEEEPALTEIDLSRLVRQSVEFVGPSAASHQIKVVTTAPEAVRATVVPGFDSVPRNLLDNAIKYTPPGGVVSVALVELDGKVVFTVADTGPGIPREKSDQLFRKFERLGAEKGPQEGHGLGLSIVAKLVELSKGKVTVEERRDGKTGAVFKVELPAAKKAS